MGWDIFLAGVDLAAKCGAMWTAGREAHGEFKELNDILNPKDTDKPDGGGGSGAGGDIFLAGADLAAKCGAMWTAGKEFHAAFKEFNDKLNPKDTDKPDGGGGSGAGGGGSGNKPEKGEPKKPDDYYLPPFYFD